MDWNFWGWFGGQLGSTVWILVAGIFAVVEDLPSGQILFFLFAIPNVIGMGLWRTRVFTCYQSTQLMIALSAACGLAAVYLLDTAHAWERIQYGGQIPVDSTYWIIALVFGGLMIMFHLRFGRAQSRRVS